MYLVVKIGWMLWLQEILVVEIDWIKDDKMKVNLINGFGNMNYFLFGDG